MSKLKKKPNDYPQFYCRMNDKEKAAIEKKIDKIKTKREKLIKEGELKPKRGDIILEALKIGLAELEKQK